MKKDIKKELKLADDHVEVEEEVDKVGDNNTCEDSLSHSKCKDDDQVDSEDHNVVNLPLTWHYKLTSWSKKVYKLKTPVLWSQNML